MKKRNGKRSKRSQENAALVDFVLRNQIIQYTHGSRQNFEIGYRLLERKVPNYNLIHVSRGVLVWVLGGVEHILRKGDLIITSPGVPHHAFSKTKRITFFSIHVNVTLPGGRNVFELLGPATKRTVKDHSRLDIYLRQASEEYDRIRDLYINTSMKGWAQLMVPELFLYDLKENLLQPKPLDPLIGSMMNVLKSRMGQKVNLDELADRSGYSPQYLNRIFKKDLGVTPLQYLNALRMIQAARDIREGKLTIKAVGERLSFDDPYYFSRVFREYHGKSPTQYRESLVSDSPSLGSSAPFPL